VLNVLTQLYLDRGQVYSHELLAQVLISRRLASQGQFFSVTGEEVGNYYECSKLALYIASDQIEEFKRKEEDALAEQPEWVRKAAGRAEGEELEHWENIEGEWAL